jgi:hypothetical protein
MNQIPILIIVIIAIWILQYKPNIIELLISIISLIILKLMIKDKTRNTYGGETQNTYGGTNLSDIDTILKKISNNYPDFKNYKKFFLDGIEKKNDVLITLDDIKHNLKYSSKNAPMKRGDHNGQRKLLLTEVQFLTKVQLDHTVKYCIYAGAAPGHKTHFLSTLFPEIKFILIDPNKFDMVIDNESHRLKPHTDIVHICSAYPNKSNEFINKKLNSMNTKEKKDVVNLITSSDYKIFIIEDFMDDKYAELFKQLGKTVFVSDIRSNTSENSGSPLDIDIYWNTSMMYNWINIIKPELSMLKIRMPFSNEKVDMRMYEDEFKTSKTYGIDFIDDYNKKQFKMSKAVFYLQAWSRPTSTEMRMYIKKDNINKIILYDKNDIEEKAFYFNTIERSIKMHFNNNASKYDNFCYCNDCALENNIWENYLKLNNNVIKTVLDAVKITNKITNRPLYKVHKGTVWQPLNNFGILDKTYQDSLRSNYKRHEFGNQKGQYGKNN